VFNELKIKDYGESRLYQTGGGTPRQVEKE